MEFLEKVQKFAEIIGDSQLDDAISEQAKKAVNESRWDLGKKLIVLLNPYDSRRELWCTPINHILSVFCHDRQDEVQMLDFMIECGYLNPQIINPINASFVSKVMAQENNWKSLVPFLIQRGFRLDEERNYLLNRALKFKSYEEYQRDVAEAKKKDWEPDPQDLPDYDKAQWLINEMGIRPYDQLLEHMGDLYMGLYFRRAGRKSPEEREQKIKFMKLLEVLVSDHNLKLNVKSIDNIRIISKARDVQTRLRKKLWALVLEYELLI